MSRQLGGMSLGMSVDQFVSSCRESSGEVQKVSDLALACSVIPSPLRWGDQPTVEFGGFIAGTFCGPDATLCELMYMVHGKRVHRDDQVNAVTRMMVSKYGAPARSDGYAGLDPMHECSRLGSVHFKRSWIFGPKQTPAHPVGWARIVFECDQRGGESDDSLTIFYSDEHGVKLRMRENKEQNDNF